MPLFVKVNVRYLFLPIFPQLLPHFLPNEATIDIYVSSNTCYEAGNESWHLSTEMFCINFCIYSGYYMLS